VKNVPNLLDQLGKDWNAVQTHVRLEKNFCPMVLAQKPSCRVHLHSSEQKVVDVKTASHTLSQQLMEPLVTKHFAARTKRYCKMGHANIAHHSPKRALMVDNVRDNHVKVTIS